MEKVLKRIVMALNRRNFLKFLSDKNYLKLMYRVNFDRKLNLKNPKSFNEKIQWLKLYDRKKEYIKMVDKYLVKEYVSQLIGQKYIIPTIGVWDRFDDIDFSKFPNKFVLKCTHDSGGLSICDDKSNFDFVDAKNKIEKSLKRKYFYFGREWPYKNVKPKILAEEFIKDDEVNDLYDYKVLCFNGTPLYIQVHKNRRANHTQDFYDDRWNKLDIEQGCKQSQDFDRKPVVFDEMMHLSKIISKDIPLVRVDWYCANGQLFFGEITFFDASGFTPFIPEKWDYIFGEKINLGGIKYEKE